MKKLTGLVAAPYTPCHADGTLNPEAVPQQAALLRESGVRGAFICGTTGESHSLATAERRQVAELWAREAGPDLPVIVHVGHNSQEEAKLLAAHAAAVGASAIAALAPSYFKPQTVDELVDFCRPIAAAAPELPFYYYHIPSLTGVPLSMRDLLRLGGERIPQLAGLKYTHNDLMMLQECLALDGGRFDVVYGSDETLLAGLAFGARGAVGSTYNYAAPIYHRVLSAFERGDLDEARRAQLLSVELVRVLIDFGVVRAGKAIMGMLGIDCGPTRPPITPLSLEERQQLHDRIAHLDIFPRPLVRAA